MVRIHRGHLVERQNFGITEESKSNEPRHILPSVNDLDEDEPAEVIKKIDLDQIPSDSDQSSEGEDSDGQYIEEENDVGYVKKRTYSVGELGNTTED